MWRSILDFFANLFGSLVRVKSPETSGDASPIVTEGSVAATTEGSGQSFAAGRDMTVVESTETEPPLAKVEVHERPGASDAWYAITESDEVWVHLLARLSNMGNAPGSITETNITLSHRGHLFGGFQIFDPRARQAHYLNRIGGSCTIGRAYQGQGTLVQSNSQVVLVDPAEPKDMEVFARRDGTFEHQFDRTEIIITCKDNCGLVSSLKLEARQLGA